MVESIANYCEILDEASSARVASWKPFFMDRCLRWCLFIESELAVLSAEEAEHCRIKVMEKRGRVPSVAKLRNALRELCRVLLVNAHISDSIYWRVLAIYDAVAPNALMEVIKRDHV